MLEREDGEVQRSLRHSEAGAIGLHSARVAAKVDYEVGPHREGSIETTINAGKLKVYAVQCTRKSPESAMETARRV